VVGPICESSDFIARDRLLPGVHPGDLLAVMSAGAYGFSMSSNYNSGRAPPKCSSTANGFTSPRKRESWEDLIRGESMPDL